MPYQVRVAGGKPIKLWEPEGYPFEQAVHLRLERVSRLPFVFGLAAMPDAHEGRGSAIGTVIATERALMPAAVGVDIGCGMAHLYLGILYGDLLTNKIDLSEVWRQIKAAVPHGRTNDGREGDRGAWGTPPERIANAWRFHLSEEYDQIIKKHPHLLHKRALAQLGTLGTGNHFVELTVDEDDQLGLMLHSGSRGVGNLIGTYFIHIAQQLAHKYHIPLEDRDLAYFVEDTEEFDDYVRAALWAQKYATLNRALMLQSVLGRLQELHQIGEFPRVQPLDQINCHHNYMTREHHHGRNLWITRKGAVLAREGTMGIIPGSMGAKSYLVRGKGEPNSFHSCSHGAGRVMSRTEARKSLSVEDLIADTEGIVCDKDEGVLDEAPKCYKPIDVVMAAQDDLVEPVHTLRQILCVKGKEDSRRRKKAQKE